MGFTVICHGCGEVIYEGVGMIPFYRLMSKCEGKCPVWKRRLSITPMKIELNQVVE